MPTEDACLWMNPSFGTVAFLVPLPFDVRIDMGELGVSVSGRFEGVDYCLQTLSASVETIQGKLPGDGSKVLATYSFGSRPTWRAIIGPSSGTLWLAYVQLSRA